MAITKQTDYLGEGLARLLEQYKNLPRWRSLLKAYLLQVQAAEDAMWDVFIDRLLQNNLAGGDLLAKLGKIVGQGSEGYSDAEFRLLILARILANRASGRLRELIDITVKLVPATTVLVRLFPKSIYIAPLGAVPVSPLLIANSFLGKAKAAGDRLDFVASQQPLATTFLFGWTGGGFTPTATQSPGWTGDASLGGDISYDYATLGGQA